MARTIIAFLIAVMALSMVVIARADTPSILVTDGSATKPRPLVTVTGPESKPPEVALRDLRLNAAGTKPAGSEQLRIPMPVDGVLYEVIVAKPGEPKLVPVATQDPK